MAPCWPQFPKDGIMWPSYNQQNVGGSVMRVLPGPHRHLEQTFSSLLFFFFKVYSIEVELIYSVMLVSGVQQNDSVIYVYICVCIYIFLNILFHYEWNY